MKLLFHRLIALVLCALTFVVPVHALSVEQALDLLDEYYIDDLPQAALEAQTLDDLIAALGDPYTVYVTKEEYDSFLSGMNDIRLVGIGVSIELHESGILIVSVVDNSPALDAGLLPGDVIVAADGVPLTTLEQAQTLLSGETGTSVTVQVLRADGTTISVELVRREIVVPTTVQYFLSDDENALVISCTSFGNETPDHFVSALKEHDSTVNAFIVDLTANPGGTSQSGAATAGCFIGGAIMLYLRDGQDRYNYTYTIPSLKAKTQSPAIVLTSPYTASSSELFLGAIRDHEAGIAIGQRTRGKGVAQIALDKSTHPELFDGDALKVTVYRFFSPNGATNDKIGIIPTLLVSLENAYHAALLLCDDYPETPAGHLRLTLNDYNYFIDLNTATGNQFRPAFVELLEALPPTAKLQWDNGSGKYVDTTAQAVAQQYGLTEYVPRTFTDLSASLYATAINTLATYKLVAGYGDGTFRPDAPVTRAEFCAMLANLLITEMPTVTQSAFSDVSIDEWYAPAVHALHKKGLLTGYEDGSFQPNSAISQQEVVCILSTLSTQLNMYAYNRRNLTPTDEVMAKFAHFSDWAQLPAWLLESCQVDLSALTAPESSATRELAADLICQLLTKTSILWH